MDCLIGLTNSVDGVINGGSKERQFELLEQELIGMEKESLLWLFEDRFRIEQECTETDSLVGGVPTSFSLDLDCDDCLFTNSDDWFRSVLNAPSSVSSVASSAPSGLLSRLSSNAPSNPPQLRSNCSSLRFQSKSLASSLSDNQSVRSPPKRMCYPEVDSPTDEMEEEGPQSSGGFVSARNQYIVDQQKKFGKAYNPKTDQNLNRKSLGGKRRFTPPSRTNEDSIDTIAKSVLKNKNKDSNTTGSSLEEMGISMEDLPEKLRSLDERFIVNILNEIIYNGKAVTWDDIVAGLAYAKKCIMEAIIWPMQRPDLFTGLRTVPRGLLLFGPPGTGKTLLGKAIANMCHCTFFSISASSLTSKWLGEGEKMVRALFGVAEFKAPSVIFIDEIDSLLSMRGENDMEGTRRIKTEFLVQLDGITSANENGNILVIGATNRPQDLDEAARRRFVKRLYIPLPDSDTRHSLLSILLKKNENTLSETEIDDLTTRSEGYSCADIHNLCREAAMGPIRDISVNDSIVDMNPSHLRPIALQDFDYAFRQVRASVGDEDLDGYRQWNEKYGSMGTGESLVCSETINL